jgi:hypothetical protein
MATVSVNASGVLGDEGMSQDRLLSRRLGRAALFGAVAIMTLYVAPEARADDDGPSVFGSIMHTLGFRRSGETYEGIDYNERSPLVVPPTRDLPPPVSGSAAPAPNWPKDADIERRKKAKKDEAPRYQVGDSVQNASRPLSPSELTPAGVHPGNSPGDGDSTANSSMADPRDAGAKKSMFSGLFKKEQYATFTGEPSRQSLTDPPPGYQTPSPDQPYGIGSAETKYKPQTVIDRTSVSSGSASDPGH